MSNRGKVRPQKQSRRRRKRSPKPNVGQLATIDDALAFVGWLQFEPVTTQITFDVTDKSVLNVIRDSPRIQITQIGLDRFTFCAKEIANTPSEAFDDANFELLTDALGDSLDDDKPLPCQNPNPNDKRRKTSPVTQKAIAELSGISATAAFRVLSDESTAGVARGEMEGVARSYTRSTREKVLAARDYLLRRFKK